MPLIVWTARKSEAMASERRVAAARLARAGVLPSAVGVRACSSASNASLITERCSRLSVWNSSAYWAASTASAGRAVAALAEYALDRFQHAARLERLDDEIAGAGLDRLDHEGLLPHGTA